MLLPQWNIVLALVAVVAVAGAGVKGDRDLHARHPAPTPVFHNIVAKRAPDDGHSYKAGPGKRDAAPTPIAVALDRRAPDEQSDKPIPTPPKRRDAAPTPIAIALDRRAPDEQSDKPIPTPPKRRDAATTPIAVALDRRAPDQQSNDPKVKPTPHKRRDAGVDPVYNDNVMAKRAPDDDHSIKAGPGKRAGAPTPVVAAAAHAIVERAPEDEGHSLKAQPPAEKRDAGPTPVFNNIVAKRAPDDSHSIKVVPPAEKRQVKPSQPLSQMGPPNFPPNIPSCYNCQQKYPSLSSCMAASAVFENATNIFNNPLQYIDVLKCSCTDTFQAVYPQCLQCFQQTNQCQYLGTDPAGTGAPDIVTNLRNVCGFASSIFGGAEAKNYPNSNSSVTPTSPPPYGDDTKTDQTAGPIFGGAAPGLSVETMLPIVATVTFVVVATLISM